MGSPQWAAACDRVVLRTLWSLQAAHAVLRTDGGAVVVAVPSVSHTGAPGHAASAAAGEATRALAKTAARQWGRDGIAVNVVAVEVDDGATLLGSTTRAVVAADVAAAVEFLVAQRPATCTGQTLVVDGGAWMPV
jgi:3-oxoacyl-[acyl-carrier protein] reductase